MTDWPDRIGNRDERTSTGRRAPAAWFSGKGRLADGDARAPERRAVRRILPSLVMAPALIVGAACCVLVGHALGTTPDAATDRAARARTRMVVAAATAFLDTLDATQRAQVLYPFDPRATPVVARFTRSAPDAPVREMTQAEQARAGAHTRPFPPPNGGTLTEPPTGGGPMGPPGGRDGNGPPPGGGRDMGPPGGGQGMGPPGGFTGERFGRTVWSNFPVSDVPRTGLRLGSLSSAQRAASMALLQTLLSSRGYAKVRDIMASDQALSDSGTPFASGENAYTVGIFGTPNTSTPWMVGFGGHHLGLNVVISGQHGVMTPTLTGAQPSVFTVGGKTRRVLAGENDKAFALLDALDPDQKRRAILPYRVADLVLGPDHPDADIVPEGVQASSMTPQQRAMLLDLISEWAGMVDEAYAAPRMAEIKAGLDQTWFCWSGPTTHAPGRNGSSYYRIQGPKLVIEFAPQDTNGDATLHVHTVYRDPTNAYGRLFTAP